MVISMGSKFCISWRTSIFLHLITGMCCPFGFWLFFVVVVVFAAEDFSTITAADYVSFEKVAATQISENYVPVTLEVKVHTKFFLKQ